MFLSLAVIANAQTATSGATATVTSPIAHPLTEGTYNILGGSNYTITYNFTNTLNLAAGQQLSGIVSATYTFGSLSGNLSATATNNNITIYPQSFTDLAAGDYQLAYQITDSYTANGSTQQASVTCTSNDKFKVWEPAKMTAGELSHQTYSQRAVTLGPVQYSGGNPNGWSVTWSDGTPSGNSQSCTFVATNNGSTSTNRSIVATVRNLAPGSTTEYWYTQTATYNVTVYPEPTAELSGLPRAVLLPAPSVILTALLTISTARSTVAAVAKPTASKTLRATSALSTPTDIRSQPIPACLRRQK